MNSYSRLMAWAHWVKAEKDPDDDRLLMARDIDKLLAVVEAAREQLYIVYGPNLEADQPCKMLRAIKNLYDARRG